MHDLLCYCYIDPYRRLHHVIFMHCSIYTSIWVSLNAKLRAGFVSKTQHIDKSISNGIVQSDKPNCLINGIVQSDKSMQTLFNKHICRILHGTYLILYYINILIFT